MLLFPFLFQICCWTCFSRLLKPAMLGGRRTQSSKWCIITGALRSGIVGALGGEFDPKRWGTLCERVCLNDHCCLLFQRWRRNLGSSRQCYSQRGRFQEQGIRRCVLFIYSLNTWASERGDETGLERIYSPIFRLALSVQDASNNSCCNY